MKAVKGLVGNGSGSLFHCVKIHPEAYREHAIMKHWEGEMERKTLRGRNGEQNRFTLKIA